MVQRYNNPTGGTQSSVSGVGAGMGTGAQTGSQFRTDYFQKQALIEARKEQYFSQLADAIAMPKNMGKKIKRYHYMPLLDDRNLNDQGIDAAGVTIAMTEYYVSFPTNVTVADASAAAAVTAINDNVNSATGTAETVATAGAAGSGGSGRTLITLTKTVVKYATLAKANVVIALNVGGTLQQGSGNLFGSSKDIGLIAGKLPLLSETGGRVNRVGFKRKELEGTFEKFGFFDEYTKDLVDFDSDEELLMHINREMINGAVEITEDKLQIDLLNAAGVIRYTGTATSRATTATEVTYSDLMKLSIDLDNNRTPKQTTMFTGTRMIDTKTIPNARVLYVGSELIPTIKAMKDLHNNPAFVSIEKYAGGGQNWGTQSAGALQGEIGAIDAFRIVVVPEMLKWSGGGALTGGDATRYATAGRFDVFPMLCVGEGSFTTISFQTDGKGSKFTIFHKKPGEEQAERSDPYGEIGFMSIKWFYGFMVLRPERLGMILTTAKL